MRKDVTALALRVADAATAAGLTRVSLTSSRVDFSSSRYLCLRDRAGRTWLIRVSDHARRARSGRVTSSPHYDLVARPAETGQAVSAAAAWLASVAAGQVAWHDPDARPARKRLSLRW